MRETLSVLKMHPILMTHFYHRAEERGGCPTALSGADPGSLGTVGFKDKPLEHRYILFAMFYFLSGQLIF